MGMHHQDETDDILHSRIEESFGDGYVRLKIEEADLRQAAHDIRSPEQALLELLRNSRDAGASVIFIATVKDASERSITVIDNGEGIPEHMHTKIFEPRVTGKLNSMRIDSWGVHGRGMALYSIAQNSISTKICTSYPYEGCAIKCVFDTNHLPERKDQSTWPEVAFLNTGSVLVGRGPHNLIKTAVQFVGESKLSLKVFFGSYSETVARIRSYFSPLKHRIVPRILQELIAAENADVLARAALQLGLDISKRSAHRILAQSIEPAASITTYLLPQNRSGKAIHTQSTNNHLSHTIHIDTKDLNDFRFEVSRLYKELAEKYFLEDSVEPDISIAKDNLTVTIPLRFIN